MKIEKQLIIFDKIECEECGKLIVKGQKYMSMFLGEDGHTLSEIPNFDTSRDWKQYDVCEDCAKKY
jgi:hypothetical protein